MKIAGLVKHSLIDYPQKIAAVVFTQGCNFRCGFCHNPDLLPMNQEGSIDEDEIIAFFKKRANVLDGVVITGGEPTLQTDLIDFIKKIKSLGLAVKLDSNGSNPEVLKTLIKDHLADYVAMDIKGPLEKYPEICGYLNTKIVQESINLLLNSDIDYEFRTTVLPYFHTKDDIEKIGELIKGAKLFTLQGFRPEITFDKKLKDERSFSEDELQDFANILNNKVVETRVINNL